MNRLLAILLITAFVSCKRNQTDPEVPAGALYQITVKGKVYSVFEYSDGRVVKASTYSICETPIWYTEFGYSKGALRTIKSASRALLSSFSGDVCDQNIPYDEHTYHLEYDAEGRVTKVVYAKGNATYQYDGLNATEQTRDERGQVFRTDRLKFDGRGNLLETKPADPQSNGGMTYEYDSNPNPMREIYEQGAFASPFTSPNNVIRGFDANRKLVFERKFTYDSDGRPLTCDEGNGVVYEYHYR